MRRSLTVLLTAWVLISADARAGEHPHANDLLIFPDVNGVHSLNGSDIDEDVFLGVNLLYTYTGHHARALVEYAVSNDEHEVERLQVGWAFTNGPIIWGGRVHNPDNYWNTTFHHGQYLQTSISRPWSNRYEDEGGPLLAHTTGMLFEIENHYDAGSAWNAYLSVGVGAHLEEDLEPFDLFSPSSDHGFSLHGRLAYLPDFLGQNQVGLIGSFDEINIIDTPTGATLPIPGSIEQFSIGVYGDWQWNGTRMISEFRYIHNELEYPESSNEHILSFYAYVEQRLNDAWTVYGRMDLIDGGDSAYLDFLEDSLSDQWVGGIRWDFSRRQALTLELQDKNAREADMNRLNIQLQWSAVFP